jgi:hypothetical protein
VHSHVVHAPPGPVKEPAYTSSLRPHTLVA